MKRDCVNKYENLKKSSIFLADPKSIKDFGHEQDCPCPDTDCERHGICCECVKYHKNKKSLSACLKNYNHKFTDTMLLVNIK